ncbi:MAG: tRNA preQ1(34) S-adenosylmethionine ribosyltransferase-isomerase QueA [Spirochaetia bacterium]
MDLSALDFNLPSDLIAYEPAIHRGNDRLMLLNKKTGKFSDHQFSHIIDLLPPHSLLVFNNSKVHKARLCAITETGVKIEFLLIRRIDEKIWLCMVQKSKRQYIGREYTLPGNLKAKIIADYADGLKHIEIAGASDEYLEEYGQIPLPPYIKREINSSDEERYQTIYAKILGSAAAPTAGLHFTHEILEELKNRGHSLVFITLHVGIGTFMPIRTDKVEDHEMHREYYEIDNESCEKINTAIEKKIPIITIGTTSCRALESAYDLQQKKILAGKRETSIFIYPGYQFNIIHGLFTNFHTPGSSLLAMVCALGGYENIKNAYAHAISKQYRFFSYGDCMLII